MKFFWWRAEALATTLITKFQGKDSNRLVCRILHWCNSHAYSNGLVCRILRWCNSFSENAAPLCKIEIERWHEENIRFFKGDFLSFCLCLFLGGLFLDLTRGTLIRFPNAKSIVTLQKAWIHISFSQHIFIFLYMLISNPWFRIQRGGLVC